jgi:guanosine-3',5'-bis(diphosphate) 3'-pyrophosphohydrolase
MKLLAKMLALVATKFEHKEDKQGKPYFEHCNHVKNTCGLTDENSLCIALGHDLVEDTDVTVKYLEENFNEEIAMGISVLTKPTNQTYDDYIKFVSNHHSIVPIKLADLRHNMDASRLKGLTKKDFDRMEKYMRAYTYLSKI